MSAFRTLIELGGLLVAIGSLAVSLCREEGPHPTCGCPGGNAMPASVPGIDERSAVVTPAPVAQSPLVWPVLPGPRFRERTREPDPGVASVQTDGSRVRLRQLIDEMSGATKGQSDFP